MNKELKKIKNEIKKLQFVSCPTEEKKPFFWKWKNDGLDLLAKYIHELKKDWQRVAKGYDDRMMWSFSDYFNQCLPTLKKFCQREIEEDSEELNKDRIAIYKETLNKIKLFEEMSIEDYFKHPNQESELWRFVGEHIGWYWD